MNTEYLTQIGLMSLLFISSYCWDKFKSSRNIWKKSICVNGVYSLREACYACPKGYRLPTVEEYQTLFSSNIFTFDLSSLQGVITFSDGFVLHMPIGKYSYGSHSGCRHAEQGVYWTSSPHENGAYVIYFTQCLVQSVFVASPGSHFSALYVRK